MTWWTSNLFHTLSKFYTCTMISIFNMHLKVSWFQKYFLVSLILPKNEQKQVNLRYHSTVGRLFFVCFSKELKRPKSPFEINWPLPFALYTNSFLRSRNFQGEFVHEWQFFEICKAWLATYFDLRQKINEKIRPTVQWFLRSTCFVLGRIEGTKKSFRN